MNANESIYSVKVDGTDIQMTVATLREAWLRGTVHPQTAVRRIGYPQWLPLAALSLELGLAEGEAPRAVGAGKKAAKSAREIWGKVLIAAGVLVAGYFWYLYDMTRMPFEIVFFDPAVRQRLLLGAVGGVILIAGAGKKSANRWGKVLLAAGVVVASYFWYLYDMTRIPFEIAFFDPGVRQRILLGAFAGVILILIGTWMVLARKR